MQWKQYLHQKPLQVLYLIFALLVLKEIVYVSTFKKTVSPIADGFSEANTIRGATSFMEEGITRHSGLPDICYNGEVILPERGSVPYVKKIGKECEDAYTHYPPGPEYVSWIAMNIVGKNRWPLLRVFPIGLSVLAGILFIWTMFYFIGGGYRGLIFGSLLLLPPMYSNYMHGLHHQQYAFLMFQVQVSLCVLYFTRPEWKKVWVLLAFALLGFFQGWMTFDFAFLATLFVIPFYILLKEEYQLRFSSLVSIGMLSGIPFTAAHVLHFLQVISFRGGFDEAVKDLTTAAAHRASNASAEGVPAHAKYNPKEIGPLTVTKDYLYRVTGRGKYLAINLMNFIWIILALKFIKRIEFRKGWKFEFNVSGRDLLGLFAAVIISSLWSLVMKQHAHVHGFIARHYYFCYLFCCYLSGIL